jgi:hypothetical protein
MVVALPFSCIKRLLRLKAYQANTFYAENKDNSPFVQDLFKIVDSISRHVFWTNTCLVRSIVLKLLLRRRNMGAILYLGLAKDANGQLKAHAWLKALDSGLMYDDGRAEFTAVAVLV